MLTAFTYALANFSYMFFVLRSEGLFEDRLAVAVPLLLYALYQFSFTLFAIPPASSPILSVVGPCCLPAMACSLWYVSASFSQRHCPHYCCCSSSMVSTTL